MNQEGLAKTNVILATCILGSLGALVRSIPMPGSVVTLGRGFVAVVFLLVLMLAKKTKAIMAGHPAAFSLAHHIRQHAVCKLDSLF